MSLPNLTSDLVLEIFSQLPIKPFVIFKHVSKHYYSQISEPKFKKLHLERSSKNTHIVITSYSYDSEGKVIWEVSPFSMRHLIERQTSMVYEDECLRFNDGLYHMVDSINGLVCFMGQKYHERNKYIYARFWNPTLWLTSTESPNLMIIPPPPNDMMLARIHRGFDYDVSTDTYRVSNILFTRYLGLCNSQMLEKDFCLP